MKTGLEIIPGGSVTSPRGFSAGATRAGIKKEDRKLDLGILFSEVPCAVAAVFTTNKIKAAPVVLSQERLRGGRAVALVANSSIANACTGEQGMADAVEMAEMAARKVGAVPEDVLVASTGVIGEFLPMDKIGVGIGRITLSGNGGHELARAIMTTDTVPKEIAVRSSEGGFIIGGIAKGSGMIHPDMATLLGFLTTDASVDAGFLRAALRRAVDFSFNMVSVDGDTSTNDTVLLMANGLVGKEAITGGSQQADCFQRALDQVCIHLAKDIARDGEGATKLIEVTVSGAVSLAEARLAARTVASSLLLKAAMHGNDPNWGRAVAALGRSGVEVEETRVDLYMGGVCLLRGGRPLPFDRGGVEKLLNNKEVTVVLNLNLGEATATAWSCDLSEEYVTINSQYTT